MSSDIVCFHKYNPDPSYDGCRATGLLEDGVEFKNVEPYDGIVTFIGRSALTEAFALLHGFTPHQLHNLMEGNSSKALHAKINRLIDERDLLAERLADVQNYLIGESKKNEEADATIS